MIVQHQAAERALDQRGQREKGAPERYVIPL